MNMVSLKSVSNTSASLVDFVNNENKSVPFLIGVLIVVCLYDLLSPPISVTIWRQTQTAMLTDNFLGAGFSLKGLYVGLEGHSRLMMTYEFPVYNFIVAIFFKLFNNSPFWGKFVSLLSAIGTIIVFRRLVKYVNSSKIAFLASIIFILLPMNVFMFTSFQPDALGVMFLMLSILMLYQWRAAFNTGLIVIFSLTLLISGLCKFPILVPYIPFFALVYFFPMGKLRLPKVSELIIITTLFIMPFIYWYLYRAQLTDPRLLGGESGTFLVGDLRRFLSLAFYIRPTIMLGMLVFCGTGIVYFLCGLRKISAVELALLIGIPFYYIVVPTVAEQYYYLYPITPIAALLMAKGIISAETYFKKHGVGIFSYVLRLGFVLFSAFGIVYVLRMDKVIIPASEVLAQISQPNDLIFVLNMHDRGVGVGGNNPSAVYFAKRNGWNIQYFQPENIKNIVMQINSKRDEGAKWLFVTWYTSDLEPWYSPLLPQQFKRAPKFDSKAVADSIRQRYPVVRSGDNFAILSLAQEKT